MIVTEQVLKAARATPQDRRMGVILSDAGRLDPADIDRVLKAQMALGLRFGETAVRLGLINVTDVRRALARQFELPHLMPENEHISSELIVASEPFHHRAEQIRALRTQLLIRWSSAGPRCQVLAIVSPSPHDGRSYLAANLAVAFAQLGRRTLLVDADMRRPRQHHIFNIDDRIGLAAVLSDRAGRDAIIPVPQFGPLALLPAGAPPPNPVELLARDRLPRLLRELGEDFDVILFDTPAAATWADAQAVSFVVGSALLVVRKDHTRLTDATQLTRRLGESGALTLGTVCADF